MFEGCSAALRMTRLILKDGLFDDTVRQCKVIAYNSGEESIYLSTEDAELPDLSLDGVYECVIDAGDTRTSCSGVILERYKSGTGKIIVFRVQNGFYKNNLN